MKHIYFLNDAKKKKVVERAVRVRLFISSVISNLGFSFRRKV